MALFTIQGSVPGMVVIFFPLIAVLALGLNFRSDALSQLPGCALAVGISIIAAVSKQIRPAKARAGARARFAPPPVGMTFGRSGESSFNPPVLGFPRLTVRVCHTYL